MIRRYEDRLAWWTSEADSGQADALNKGFARAGGDVLGWLASDDVLVPGAIARVVDELERRPDAMLVYGEALFVDESGAELFPLEPRAVRRRGDGARLREPRRAAGLALPTPCLGAGRAAERAGPLPLRLRVRACGGSRRRRRADPRPACLVPRASRVQVGRRVALEGTRLRALRRRVPRRLGAARRCAGAGECVPRRGRLLLRRGRARRRAACVASGRCV